MNTIKKVERTFNGNSTLEKALLFILNGQIDKIAIAADDDGKANTPLLTWVKKGSMFVGVTLNIQRLFAPHILSRSLFCWAWSKMTCAAGTHQ